VSKQDLDVFYDNIFDNLISKKRPWNKFIEFMLFIINKFPIERRYNRFTGIRKPSVYTNSRFLLIVFLLVKRAKSGL
jgi:hypothetical protein